MTTANDKKFFHRSCTVDAQTPLGMKGSAGGGTACVTEDPLKFKLLILMQASPRLFAHARLTSWAIFGSLIALTLAGYGGVGRCGFVNIDDDSYVQFQPLVNHGLRSAEVLWVFTASHSELGQIRLGQNRMADALTHNGTRARQDCWNADAQCDYGTRLGNLRRFDEAFPFLERALWILPSHARARDSLASFRRTTQPP
jgi:hypothetical protein